MKRRQRCADWEELLAVSDPEQNLSPAEYAQLQEHLAQCPGCAALHESYRLMTAHLRALAAAQPLSDYATGLERNRARLAAQIERLEAGAPDAAVSPTKREQRNQRERAPRRRMQLGPAFAVAVLIVLAFVLFHKPYLIASLLHTLTGSGGLWQKMDVMREGLTTNIIDILLILAVPAALGIALLGVGRSRNTLRVGQLSLLLLTPVLAILKFLLAYLAFLGGSIGRLVTRLGKRSVFFACTILIVALGAGTWILGAMGGHRRILDHIAWRRFYHPWCPHQHATRMAPLFVSKDI